MLNFNDAAPQRDGELIPDKTFAKVMLSIRPGGHQASGGWLKQSDNKPDVTMLDCEFTVLEGPHANRKFWQYMVLSGGKSNDRGESIAADISRSTLRAILESARGITPSDMSQQAINARMVQSYEEFDGIIFACKIGVEKSKDPQYSDKNKLLAVITNDRKEYQPIMTGVGILSASESGSKPSWGSTQPSPAPASSAPPPWEAPSAATAAPTAAAPGNGKSTVPAWAQ